MLRRPMVPSVMRGGVLLTSLGAFLALGAAVVRADGAYEIRVRTSDLLVSGTVELEERIVVAVRGDRIRQEATGTRAVVTRRGARYEKPGHRLTLDQLDRGRRYDVNLEAATYAEEALADTGRRREAELAAAEKSLGIDPAEAVPALAFSVERTGERLQIHGRECERVVLRSTREALVALGRGAAKPVSARFAMTSELCLAPDMRVTAEARSLEERLGGLTGARGAAQDRQLRVFAHRRDVFAVFELMHQLMEREQQRLGGVALRWEWVFSGPRRAEPQATLVRQRGEITRIEGGPLEASGFELPSGLTRIDTRDAPSRAAHHAEEVVGSGTSPHAGE